MNRDDRDPTIDEQLRPVAIGGSAGGWNDEPADIDAAGSPLAPGMVEPLEPGRPQPPTGRLEVERPLDEGLVGVAALVLAVSVFLPWYASAGFAPVSISGWASGNWGPITFFLAVAVVAIVVLRLARVPVSLPLPHSMVLEVMGWAAVIMVLIKRFLPPEGFGILGMFDGGFLLGLVGGVGVAMLASRLSKDTPVVMLPGWFRGRAGAIGATILVMALGAGVAFGLMNSVQKAREQAFDQRPGPVPTISAPPREKGLPACAKRLKFPVPAGVTPVSGHGLGQPDTCQAELTSKLTIKQLEGLYRAALRDAGWKFSVIPTGTEMAILFQIEKPTCGTFAVTRAKGEKVSKVQLFVGTGNCPQLRTPSPNPSN